MAVPLAGGIGHCYGGAAISYPRRVPGERKLRILINRVEMAQG